MTDEELRRLLKTVESSRARPGFAQRVLLSLEKPGRRAVSLASWRWAVAAVLTLSVIGVTGWRAAEFQENQEHLAEVESLRQESDRLAAELATLRTRAAQAPVVYLGGTEDVDYVIDFARFDASRSIQTADL